MAETKAKSTKKETSQPRIMVFCPMYNCEKQIGRVVAQFDEPTQRLFEEIVIIDNGSQDKSLKAAQEALGKLKHMKGTLLQNEKNYSLGGTIKRAFNYAVENGYDYVINLHGDDQANIHDMVPHIESGLIKQHDMVIGARFHKDSEQPGYSLVRTLGNKALNLCYAMLARRRIDDMIAGLTCFKVDFLKQDNHFYLKFPNDLTYDPHFLLYAIHKKADFVYVPLTWREEDQTSNAKVVKQALIILKLLASYVVHGGKIFEREHPWTGMDYKSKVIFQNDAKTKAA